MNTQADRVKADLKQTVSALTSDAAITFLRRAFEDASILPDLAGQMGPSDDLATKIGKEKAELFMTERARQAFRLALRQLADEHRRLSRHASILLALFSVGMLVTFVLLLSALLRGGATDGIVALVNAVPSSALGFWYQSVSKQIGEVRADTQRMENSSFGKG